MNSLESQLDYPFGDTIPAAAEIIDVAPGVRWLRMGLPFVLNHINLWLIADQKMGDSGIVQGWAIVDCGIDNEATRDAWETLFADALQGLPVLRVIATHCHPDHIGLAHWLCQRWNVPLWMSAGEYAFGRLLTATMPGVDGEAMRLHFQRHGVSDPEILERLRTRNRQFPKLVPDMPPAFIRMQEGTAIRIGDHDWHPIAGYGHSPEHIALHCPAHNVLIAGDMLLPRISTNVSVMPIEPESDPVRLYLSSIAKFNELPPDTLVLPSHGKPFRGLRRRIEQLVEHHAARLEEVRVACCVPCSANDIVPIMFRRALDPHQLTFALGEALAHLHKLWFDGTVRRQQGADGVYRFVRTDTEDAGSSPADISFAAP